MNKVALVTGSTSGIGQSIAEALASRGCHVIITGFGDEGEINKLVNRIRSQHNVQVNYLFADLTKPDDITAFWREVTQLYPTGVDILVNCAGIQKRAPIEELPTEDWNRIISVMLTAPFQLIKLALPAMKKKGWGRIINISSVRGLAGSPYGVAYCAAKHGIIGLTKVVALETAQTGITCNAICPGYVNTPLTDMLQEAIAKERGVSVEKAKELIADVVPTRKAIEPSQVAALALFMCSEEASQMTGSSVVMDGGMTAE